MGFTEIRIGSVYDYAPLIGKEIGNIVANIQEKRRTKTLRGFNELMKHAIETGDRQLVVDYKYAKTLFPHIDERTWEIFSQYVQSEGMPKKTTGATGATEGTGATGTTGATGGAGPTKGTGGTGGTGGAGGTGGTGGAGAAGAAGAAGGAAGGAAVGPDGKPLPTNGAELQAERDKGVEGGSAALPIAPTTTDTDKKDVSASRKSTVGGTMKRAGVDSDTASFMDEVTQGLADQTNTIKNQTVEREDPVLKNQAYTELSTTLDRLNILFNDQPGLGEIEVPDVFKNPRVAELYRERSMKLREGEIARLKVANEVQQLRMANTLASNSIIQDALKNSAAFAREFNTMINTRNTAALQGFVAQLQAGLGAVQTAMNNAELQVRKEIAAQSEAFQLASLKLQTRANGIAATNAALSEKYKTEAALFEESLKRQAAFMTGLGHLAKSGVFENPNAPENVMQIAALRNQFAEILQDQVRRNPFAMLTWIQDTVGRNDQASKFIRMMATETFPDLMKDLFEAGDDVVLQRQILGRYAERFLGANQGGILPAWAFGTESREELDKTQEQLVTPRFSPQSYRR